MDLPRVRHRREVTMHWLILLLVGSALGEALRQLLSELLAPFFMLAESLERRFEERLKARRKLRAFVVYGVVPMLATAALLWVMWALSF
jgi:hypothetical protein